MNMIQGPFRWAVGFLLISAALYILAFVIAGFSPAALRLIPFGIAYILLAMGLARGWRWLAYIVFIGAAIAGIFALTNIWGPSDVPPWWFAAIVAANWLCAASLLIVLWKSPPSLVSASQP